MPRRFSPDLTCDGSGLKAERITAEALLSGDVVLRYAKGICPACSAERSTDQRGRIRTHTDRKAPQ